MAKRKINVGILFGGKSAEHEISLLSAKNVIEALDKSKFNPVIIGIAKDGRWLLGENSQYLLNAGDPKLIKLNLAGSQCVAMIPHGNGKVTHLSDPQFKQAVDVVFPLLHGPLGEDGTVQGLLKLADVPFVGPSVLGSAVCMDKDVSKRLLRDAGIPVCQFLTVRDADHVSFNTIVKKLGLPFFIKPANLGSSVGISKVKNAKEFKKAMDLAFNYDTKVIVEECVKGREIECAVLGNDDLMASLPGEVVPSTKHGFYSYEAKYLDEDGAVLIAPAKLTAAATKKIQKMAVAAFRALECTGMGRVDFFLKENGEALVNEINTIPGFTSISMYPRLWGVSGLGYTDLISKLIELAMEKFNKEKILETSR